MRGLLRVSAVGAILVTQIGATWQRNEPFVASSYVHAQRLIDVGGRRMNIYCSGSDSPTVILDAGLGDGMAPWGRVQGPISRHTRVCSYDRAGMGFSDPTTSPRDAGALVGDLHALLRGAGVAPPYVLVGHSIAALYTRLYADRYPKDVVGLVLVDPTTEYDDEVARKVAPAYAQATSDWNNTWRECATSISRRKCPDAPASTAQIQQLLKAAGCPNIDPAGCSVQLVVAEHMLARSYWQDEALEALAIPTSSAQVHHEQRRYGDLPLIVLTAQPESDPGPIPRAQMRSIWTAQKNLPDRIAALSSRGAHFEIDGAGHYIQLDRPSAVISAVDEVVDQARYGAHRDRSSADNSHKRPYCSESEWVTNLL